jgi:hypothetical protein
LDDLGDDDLGDAAGVVLAGVAVPADAGAQLAATTLCGVRVSFRWSQ